MKTNWNEALMYASHENKFIPSKEQAKKLCLPNCWTSTTYDKSINMAYVNGEVKAISKLESRNVILVDKLESNQKISYAIGDVQFNPPTKTK